MKNKIQVVEIETGLVKSLNPIIAHAVVKDGLYSYFDGKSIAPKQPIEQENEVEQVEDCEDCTDDNPCEGCEKSAETTNIPVREVEVEKQKRGKAK